MEKIIENIITSGLKESLTEGGLKISEEINPTTIIFGNGGRLDSLGLVSFLINLEQKVEEEYDMQITIADEKAMSMSNSPFKNVKRLTSFLVQKCS